MSTVTPVVAEEKPTSPEWLNFDKILRRLVPFICLGVVGNLAYSWFSTDRATLDFSRFSWGWLLVAMMMAMLPWVWHSLRLAIWGWFFGVKISWLNLLRIAVATDVGGAVTPTAVGGAPLKVAMLVQQGYRPGQATTLTLWGNIEDMLFYVFAIPVSLFLTKNWDNPLWQATGSFFQKNKYPAFLALLVIAAILLTVNVLDKKKHRKAAWMEKLHLAFAESRATFQLIFSKGRQPFAWSFLVLVAQWLTRFCVLLAVVRMLGLEADFFMLLLLQWMVFVAMLLTPTPGAAGGAEAAFLLVFAGSLPEGTEGAVVAGWRLLTYYFILVVGAVFLSVKLDERRLQGQSIV